MTVGLIHTEAVSAYLGLATGHRAEVVVVGAAVTIWYDRKGLDRLPPEVIEYANSSVQAYHNANKPAKEED
jgi:hypothetical protein